MKYKYNPPKIIKSLFKEFVWESKTDKILITFDDGPLPGITESILNLLDDNNLKTIFFCVGNNIVKDHSLTKEILSAGHTIGNHTFNHKRITGLNRIAVNHEINSFNKLLKEKFNYEVKYFRPPHGKFGISTPQILKEKKLIGIMWSLLTYDYKNDINLVKFAIDKYLQNNSIIVLHENIKSKTIILDSIKYIIESGKKNDFKIGEPSECLK